MKRILILLAFVYCPNLYAQMTLAHHYPIDGLAEAAIVNLSISGKKIMTLSNTTGRDTIFFYNMDYTPWKQIVCPDVAGYYKSNLGLFRHGPTVYYPSETLFNLDTLLEAGVYYGNAILIINENGDVTDSITRPNGSFQNFLRVYETSSGVFKATVPRDNGISIINLPGTIPCSPCSGTLGLAKNEESVSEELLTQPVPNPSGNQVKITFALPEGISYASLELFNGQGQKIKSYKVDNRFGFIMLDNSALPAGVYYYNIVANGTISSTQKMVVIK